MSTVPQTNGATQLAKIEQVLMNGDLSKLTETERVGYYKKVCESLGLNPLTKPFDYITLNGKLTLYARKDATEQLRKIHGVSVYDLTHQTVDDIFVVTAKARDKDGREDSATGAVNVIGLKGESKANAMMKAETKAKRRVTLSICGLGMLDEVEVEAIEDAKRELEMNEQLNSRIMKLHKPFLIKFPKFEAPKFLNERYRTDKWEKLSVEQKADFLKYVEGQLKPEVPAYVGP
jgi:hypothetical protein